MAMRSTKRGIALFSGLAQMKSVGFVVAAFGIIVFAFAFGCEQKAGIRPSAKAPGQVEAQGPAPAITDAQCVNCHSQQPETIGAQGAKHRTEVGCQDCHVEHPPEGANAVPECSMCHSDGAHMNSKGVQAAILTPTHPLP